MKVFSPELYEKIGLTPEEAKEEVLKIYKRYGMPPGMIAKLREHNLTMEEEALTLLGGYGEDAKENALKWLEKYGVGDVSKHNSFVMFVDY